MGKYTVTAGQNIFDIAIYLYGALEGLLDLFINNPSLSYSNELNIGDELTYTDEFVINKDIISYNKIHNIIPANGERHIYFKESRDIFLEAYISNLKNSTTLSFSGEGTLVIDWGDNTELEKIILDKSIKEAQHYFNNTVFERRKVRLYGNVKFQFLDLSNLEAEDIYLFKPLYTEKFILHDADLNIEFAKLLESCYQCDLTGVRTQSLFPLLKLKKLMFLKLNDIHIKSSAIDEYLIGLVEQYEDRRNCHISLTISPTGVYKEPTKDINGNYILTSGMEAIWIILHEPSWNEGGNWEFIINGKIYTYEQND
ncbi:hypothetical protein POZ03_16800 [Bacteroides uniformis]|uniref:hypothetical protein n=1 Tax=Bacteroides uniformis TaxID=820 RepID=UPI00233F7826|nr:hypothetical protein [Bacteroides uniformis]MDC1812120.1 hypothetical protein [Bacteroides uniformis]